MANKLQNLIQELCPEGVKFVKLGEVRNDFIQANLDAPTFTNEFGGTSIIIPRKIVANQIDSNIEKATDNDHVNDHVKLTNRQKPIYNFIKESNANDYVNDPVNDPVKLTDRQKLIYNFIKESNAHDHVNDHVNDHVKLTNRQKLIYNFIKEGNANDHVNARVKAHNVATFIDASIKTARRELYILRDYGLVRHVGSDKTGHWEVVIND